MKINYTFKTLPDQVQLDGLKKALQKKKYGIFFQQRIGKTKVAIDYLGALWMANKIKRVVIVSPLSARSVWVEQFDEHMSPNVCYNVFLYPNTPAKRHKTFNNLDPEKLQVTVINYDKLGTQKDFIKKWKPDAYVFDESHLLKNPTSKRSKNAYNMAKEVEYCLLLTGTPIPKKPHDIFSQFRVMNDNIFGRSWAKFKNKHCIMGGYMGYEIVGYENPDWLSKTIAAYSIRALRKDVMDEPKVEHVSVPVELEPKAWRAYDDLKRLYITELNEADAGGATITADMAGVRTMRLQQVCGGFIPDDEGELQEVSTAKHHATIDLIETLLEGGKSVVVFYRFTAEGEKLRETLKRHGHNAGLFNGKTPEAERYKMRDEFQTKKLPVLILQIATGAMGIPLHASSDIIFYSMDFSLSNFMQARDRVMGREQKDDVTLWFMTVKKTVDERIINVLRKDEDLASHIADRWRWMLGD